MTYDAIQKKVKEIRREFNHGLITTVDAFRETKNLGVKKAELEKELRKMKNLGLVTRDQANDIENLINS